LLTKETILNEALDNNFKPITKKTTKKNRGKDEATTTLWVDNWFESCSLTFLIKFVSNYKLLTKISILGELSLLQEIGVQGNNSYKNG